MKLRWDFVLILSTIIHILASTILPARTTEFQPDETFQGKARLRGKSPVEFHTNSERPAVINGPSGQTIPRDRNCTLEGQSANCTGLNLYQVPQDLPHDIHVLDLRNNVLTYLPNFTFAKYSMLLYLNLSHNRISSLGTAAFYNLLQLEELSLRENHLAMNSKTYPNEVFCPLMSLTHLDLSLNTNDVTKPGLNYPDKALSCLTNLSSLHIDGLPMTNRSESFGDGFNNLTKLTTLSLEGSHGKSHCALGGLYNHSFGNVKHLEHLYIHHCNIVGEQIDSGAFLNLTNLRSLDIHHNTDIGTEYLENIFFGLNNLEHFTELNIGSVVSRCYEHLTILRATGNNFEAVSEQVMDKLPPNLTVLDLSNNRFTVGVYMRQLSKMTKLKHLYMNGYNQHFAFPTLYPYLEGLPRPANRNCTTLLRERQKFALSLPPNLISVEMNNAGLSYAMTNLKINENNSLTNLSLHGNNFLALFGPIYGLHLLKFLDISSCFVKEISPKFFKSLTSLGILRLDTNLLGDFLSSPENEGVFSALINLTSLNLSFNYIRVLPTGIFKSLSNLHLLHLKKNPLVSFDVDLSGVRSLNFLDLTRTNVNTLPQQIRVYFDHLLHKHISVSVSLEMTPISCECGNLEFLQWMTTTKIFAKPLKNYTCATAGLGHLLITDEYEKVLTELRRKCSSNVILFFLVGSATIAVICIIIGAVVYQFRLNIRYLHYATYLRYRQSISAQTGNAYEYDAFIWYADEDAHFAERTLDSELGSRGLKIFIHRRDFEVGVFTATSIVNAVCSSKKTVVLLTRALMDDHFCLYAIDMAKIEGLVSGRQVLIFVLMEKIPKSKLGNHILYDVLNNTYLEYDTTSVNESGSKRVWWDKLCNAIKA